MKIKVCGMREEVNIADLLDLKPDYMGLIFYPGSKRFAEALSDINLINSGAADTTFTGVFVDASLATVIEKVEKYQLGAVQLHGIESPEYIEELRNRLQSGQRPVQIIKAFGVDQDFDFNITEAYLATADYFLFDTKTDLHGGSGRQFNWQVLKKYPFDKPYFLSGGIGPDDIEKLSLLDDPRVYAVDLNSRFEVSAGLKDMEKLAWAIQTIRKAKVN